MLVCFPFALNILNALQTHGVRVGQEGAKKAMGFLEVCQFIFDFSSLCLLMFNWSSGLVMSVYWFKLFYSHSAKKGIGF